MSLFKKAGKQGDTAITKSISVIKDRCPQNHACPSVRVCPVGALSQKGFQAPIVNSGICIKCSKCVHFCAQNALVLK